MFMADAEKVEGLRPFFQHHTINECREPLWSCGVSLILGSLSSILLLLLLISTILIHFRWHSSILDSIQECTLRNLHNDLSFLNDTPAIATSEFLARRDKLAGVLHNLKISAFIVEPGYTFQYYANVSQTDWEPWEPEERPFLTIISPYVHSNGAITARTTFLAPAFEEGRVRMLNIPSDEDLKIVTWEEHWDPYLTLLNSNLFRGAPAKVMVDEEMRDYIVRGLTSVGFETIGLHPDVEAVRQQKSPAEITLLRAVNTGTVIAIRAMRPCLVPTLAENDVTKILNDALLSIPGFSLFFNVVLFNENAASPHGGFDGSKKMEYETMVLIDVGAHYKGYSSDVCRSFMIDAPKEIWWWRIWRWRGVITGEDWRDESSWVNKGLYEEKLKIWDLVFDAQTSSIEHFVPNATAASVDIAARDVIAKAGCGKHFTHRVGHGIGIKAHESPYLHEGNTGVRLKKDMTFTSEPGVHLQGKFGVRHEDVFMVRGEGDGGPLLLSGRRARGVRDP